jgi:hypothetical protein
MSKIEKFKATAKSDLRESGKRVAVAQISKAAQAAIVNLLSEGKTEKEKKSIRDTVSKSLSTPGGQAMISFMLGAMAPMMEEKCPEKYQELLAEIGQEFRVQGEVYAATQVTDVLLMPAVKAALDGVTSSLDKVLEADQTISTGVRAEDKVLEMPKPLNHEEVAATKDALKAPRKKG